MGGAAVPLSWTHAKCASGKLEREDAGFRIEMRIAESSSIHSPL